MKIIFLFLIFFSFLSASDIESDEALIEGREIAPLPETDERINGYRTDYKKPKENLIELPQKYRKKEKKKEKPESVQTFPETSLPNAPKTKPETPKPEIKPEPVQTFSETSLQVRV